MSVDSEDALRSLQREKTSHQELPYLIHANTYVPYLQGRRGHTITAIELKIWGWKIGLVKNNKEIYIAARKGEEKWLIQVISTNMKLSDAFRKVKFEINEELEILAEENGALPVIALVALDSASLISAKTLVGLSLG